LVAVLFGSGTDFCLFLSWRYAENWDADDPAAAMERTKKTSSLALLTSAGTVIIGLALMGTTKFRLFSSTGPSVALGLSLTLLATLTLTPALLILLTRWRPSAFRGMTSPSSGIWDRIGALAMTRPLVSWVAALVVMAPLAIVGLRTRVIQDLMTELPQATPSARTFSLLADKFEPGMLAPLTLVLESRSDLRSSEGLALIDDLSRFLTRQRGLTEVRSATQPLGSPEPLRRARIASRVTEVNEGLEQMAGGASELQKGLYEGAAKLRAALWLESRTGLPLTPAPDQSSHSDEPRRVPSEVIAKGFSRAAGLLLGGGTGLAPAKTEPKPPPPPSTKPDPREAMLSEILRAAEGAQQLAEGASRAREEVDGILNDPVGRRSLDRLLINPETVKAFPDLQRSFDAYLTPDGRTARFDLSQADRVFSGGAMDYVERLRRLISGFLEDAEGPQVKASLAGPNAENADVRALTRSDQLQSWFVVPIGVFLVLLVALRDPLACLNLVATMLLTYAFALGATHLVFVNGLGAEGLDWKVPYFLFVLLVAVGVDYNVFLMARLDEESSVWGLRTGIVKAIGSTGGLISSAAAITACSFASFMTSPLISLQQLGFALVVGISMDALLVRPLLVPCGHWLLSRHRKDAVGRHAPSAALPETSESPSVLDGSPALVD
ncbi:MAG: MMPL family transporter, partial [Isosphaeraceae bacterium]